MLAASGSATTYNPTMNLTYTTGPAVTFRTPFSSANVTTPNQYVPGCSGLVVHVINTVLLPVAASALAPAVTAAVAALPSPPPPKSAATSFGNMVRNASSAHARLRHVAACLTPLNLHMIVVGECKLISRSRRGQAVLALAALVSAAAVAW